MNEIKPRMVDGEARCDSRNCRFHTAFFTCDFTGAGPTNDTTVCWPWYRSRVAELERKLDRATRTHGITITVGRALADDDEAFPLSRFNAEVVDIGHMDHIYLVESEELNGKIKRLRSQLAASNAVIEGVRELIVEECEIASITNGVSLSVAKIRALLSTLPERDVTYSRTHSDTIDCDGPESLLTAHPGGSDE
jgi:hypothetical protein